jgi:hypothetical protein
VTEIPHAGTCSTIECTIHSTSVRIPKHSCNQADTRTVCAAALSCGLLVSNIPLPTKQRDEHYRDPIEAMDGLDIMVDRRDVALRIRME